MLFPAYEFILTDGAELFPGVPVVFCTIQEQQLKTHPPRSNITGVSAKIYPKNTLESALKLQPETRKVVVIGGAHSNDRIAEETVREEFKDYEGKLEIEYLTGTAIDTVLNKISALQRDTIVLYITIFLDGAGKAFVPIEIASVISEKSSVPVYGLFGTFIGKGIVGGNLLAFEEQGKKAAEIALRILLGEKPSDIPILPSPNVFQFDWRQLVRWNLSESRLPPESAVLFKKSSLWSDYKKEIIGIAIFFVIQSLFTGLLIAQRLRRRKIENTLRESEARYRLLFEMPKDAVFLVDCRTGRIIETNSAAASLYGFKREEILSLNKTVLSAEHPENNSRLETYQAVPFTWHRRKDGTLFPVEIAQTRFFWKNIEVQLEYVRDVTFRIKAEEEIREKNVRLAAANEELMAANEEYENQNAQLLLKSMIVMNMSEGVCIVRGSGGIIIEANPRFDEMFGYEAGEMIEKHLSIVIAPADINPEEKAGEIMNTIARVGVWKGEMQNMKKNGTVFFCYASISAFNHHEHGELIIAVLTDITGQKKNEEKIKSSLREKEILLKEVNHRVKNNMNVIISLINLQADKNENEVIREEFRIIENRIRSMSNVHENLYKSENLAYINFDEYLQYLCKEIYQSYIKITGKISYIIYAKNINLEVDKAIPCSLIINELFTNAIKYAFPGDRDGEIVIDFRKNEMGYFFLTVSDNGIGIPPGFDVKSKASLGFEIVNSLAAQLKGKMEISGNRGMKVTITFPDDRE